MGQTITIEKTSKRYKGRLVLAALGIIVGISWFCFAVTQTDPTTGQEIDTNKPLAVIVVSLIFWLITKIQIWWNHG